MGGMFLGRLKTLRQMVVVYVDIYFSQNPKLKHVRIHGCFADSGAVSDLAAALSGPEQRWAALAFCQLARGEKEHVEMSYEFGSTG